MNRNSTLFFFFSTLFEILPWENGFQLWVGCFPGSRSLKATSETSGLFSFKSLENSQRTAGNHLSTAIIRVNLEKKKNRLLFLIKGPFSTVITATSNFSFPTSNFSFPWAVFREENFCFLHGKLKLLVGKLKLLVAYYSLLVTSFFLLVTSVFLLVTSVFQC